MKQDLDDSRKGAFDNSMTWRIPTDGGNSDLF